MTTTPRRPEGLAARLRLMVLTPIRPPGGLDLLDLAAACLSAGATAIQLRDKEAGADALVRASRALLQLTSAARALLVINDRLDVALAARADGVHLGPRDLPVAAARSLAPRPFLIGYSTDDPCAAARARDEGADYLGVGAVFGTTSKPGLADEAIGPAGVAAVRRASGLPCLGIGGITPRNAADVFSTGAGVAVLGAVLHAPDPSSVVRHLARLANA